jgi:hypothetical protein
MWFDRNMIQINELEVENLIGAVDGRFSKAHQLWLHKYHAWIDLAGQTWI